MVIEIESGRHYLLDATQKFSMAIAERVLEHHYTGIAVSAADHVRSWPEGVTNLVMVAPPDQAKSLKENARVMLLAKWKSPFFGRGSSLPDFLFSNYRYKVTFTESALVAEPLC